MKSKLTHALALREAIWPLHARLESLPSMLSVAEGQASLEEYVSALAKLYGFIAPLEQGLSDYGTRFSEASELSRYLSARTWSRLGLLIGDLRRLGIDEDKLRSLPACCNLPKLDQPEKALGHLYVLEGSRLGGKVIAAQVKHSLGLGKSDGCSYFASDGLEVSGYWSDFKMLIESSLSPQSLAVAVKAAGDCFLALEDWLKEGPG